MIRLDGGFLLTLVFFGLILVFAFGFILIVTRYKRCASDEILVVYGRVSGGGSSRCIHGGGTMVWPNIQDYKILSLAPMTIPIELNHALSKENFRVNVPCKFTVAISTEPVVLINATERLLHLNRSQIEEMASEIAFGQLRLVISSLTLIQIQSEREVLHEIIWDKVGNELNKIGLKIINFDIIDVSRTTSVDVVTAEKITHYLDLTQRARAKATPIHQEGTEQAKQLAVMMRMADDYSSDANHFMEKGDYVRAFGAINYAHAWIDAGVKLRLLDGHGDDVLFTLP